MAWTGNIPSSTCRNSLAATAAERPGRASRRIVVDAGHGGKDGGTTGRRGTAEKDVNLAVVYTVKEQLEAAGAFVVLTRVGDETLPSRKGWMIALISFIAFSSDLHLGLPLGEPAIDRRQHEEREQG